MKLLLAILSIIGAVIFIFFLAFSGNYDFKVRKIRTKRHTKVFDVYRDIPNYNKKDGIIFGICCFFTSFGFLLFIVSLLLSTKYEWGD